MAIELEYLTPDQLKPFLLHPDSLVRARVAGYFRDAATRDTDLIPMTLAACDEYLEDDDTFSLGACMDFPLTEGSFFLVLGALSWVNAAESVFVLNEILATMPLAIFEKNRALMARPRIDPRTRKRIERRLDFSTRGSGELWQRLREFSDNAKDEWCPDCVDQREAADLVEALTCRWQPSSIKLIEDTPTPRVLSWLCSSPKTTRKSGRSSVRPCSLISPREDGRTFGKKSRPETLFAESSSWRVSSSPR